MTFREKDIARLGIDNKQRTFRVNIAFDDLDDNVLEWPEVEPPEASFLSKSFAFNAEQTFGRLPDVGHCIYCGKTEYAKGQDRPLGAEHIIPEGIGGKLELPCACCLKHEGLTSSLEGSVQKVLLQAVRSRIGLRGKKRKREKISVKITSLLNGQESELFPPIDEHPTILVLPRLQPPGALFPNPGLSGVFFHPLVSLDTKSARSFGPFVVAHVDMFRFCQFLAKIGHAFASAMIGKGLFDATLTPLITSKSSDCYDMKVQCYRYIGGFYNLFRPSKNLHELEIAFNESADNTYILVYIRLFANMAGPVYMAVVGTVPREVSVSEIWRKVQSRRAAIMAG
jgi:hypothetical protein